MPRNPFKTRCQAPGCRSWAMRGHDLCRFHRDHQLGPRGAGAPQGNLNALKHAQYSHPLSQSDLEQLASQICQQPDHLPDHVARITQTLHDRIDEPLLTLLALRRLLVMLIPIAAQHIFSARLRAATQHLPPSQRPLAQATIVQSVAHLSAEEKILFLQKIARAQEK